MSVKQLIKSRVKINNDVQTDISKCLNHYLKYKKVQNNAPFQIYSSKMIQDKPPSKFKKSLSDWRSMYSQPKFQKTSRRSESLCFGKQNSNNAVNNKNLSYTRSTFSSHSLRKQHTCTADKQCRKIHSSFQNRQTQNSDNYKIRQRHSQVFSASITPFIIVQNIYQANLKDFEVQKRSKTARIRNYFETKAQKVQQFQEFDKIQEKVNKQLCSTAQQQVQFIRSKGALNSQRKYFVLTHRRSNRIIHPDEHFKECKKIKIPKKCIVKDYPVNQAIK